MMRIAVLIALGWAVAGSTEARQAVPPQEETLTLPGAQARSGQGPEWQVFTRSAQRAYLVDPSTLRETGGVTSIQIARAPFAVEDGDPAWTLETFEFRCSAGEYRTTQIAEFNADGSAATPPETLDEAFEAIAPNGLSGYLKAIACDGQRARPPYYPSLAAWIAAGRK